MYLYSQLLGSAQIKMRINICKYKNGYNSVSFIDTNLKS